MITSPRIISAMRRMKKAGWEKIEDWNQRLDDQSVMMYIDKIQKEDNVTYEEAWELCRTDPKYSMGLKMCSPSIVMDMAFTPGGKDRFRRMLTPEELALFDSEVDGKFSFAKIVKKEYKRQKKEGIE